MDRRCSQSVRTLIFDDSDSDLPNIGKKKDLSSTGAPSSLNQSAEGMITKPVLFLDSLIRVRYYMYSRFVRLSMRIKLIQ
ncbi:hypothetical protein RR46_01032 [Papilio xuthus]|uniref:Uncharacterized protein n=1 Tax=Papilio xuthus TaxID=66420 RepID=A0A0N0PA36_PAPXU|nr:hypothetical protein RR46_01032 [Papilio xuthus]